MNGIPVLSSITASSTATIILGSAEAKLWELLGSFAGQWGIYPANSGDVTPSFGENLERVVLSTPIGTTTIGELIGGQSSGVSPVVTVDSIRSLDSRHETQVCDYRIEQGGFASYNKVQVPDMVMIEMARGGGLTNRKTFLSWLETNVQNPTVYDIVVPERTYQNMTLESYEVIRDADNGGASLIIARCAFRKIMTAIPVFPSTANASTENAQSANDAPTSLAQRVSASVMSAADSVIGKVTNSVKKVGSVISAASSIAGSLF